MSQALDIVDRAIDRAQAEVERLTRLVKSNAEGLTADPPRVAQPFRWQVTDDLIALQCARAQVAALRTVWADIARADEVKP